ncbi:MAG: DUF4956 domain-containing protein, partial [Gemmatimonadales bacterium]
LWKMAAYFLLLGLAAFVMAEIFRELSRTMSVAEFTRASDLLTSILNVEKQRDDLIVTGFSLMVTFLMVIPVGWVYLITRETEGFDPSLTQTLIVLSIVVCGVMLMLEDSLARAFGLVGVVAAVRYRNTLKDPKDAVYVFLAIGIGMGAGLQLYHVSVLLAIFVCGVFLLLWAFRTGTPKRGQASLLRQLSGGGKKDKAGPSPAQAMAMLTSEARQRLRDEFELQSRLVQTAGLFSAGSGKKAPNSAIIVETAGAGLAQGEIHAQMADHPGRWRLIRSETTDGVTRLEYLGRLSRKQTPPTDLLDQIQLADSAIRQVAFRSLRGIGAEHVEVFPEHTTEERVV